MYLSNQQKILVLAVAVLGLVFFMTRDKENYQNNNEHMAPNVTNDTNNNDNVTINKALDDLMDNSNNINYNDNDNDSITLSDQKLNAKMTTKNSAKDKYKKSSYDSGEGRASNDPDQLLDDFFVRGNNVTDVSSDNNTTFIPANDANGNESFASYKHGQSKNNSTKDIYNIDNYLPQQVNDQWFDNVPEPISVQNRYLINISKQVGVNTIGTTKVNASHDFRGDVYCPKFVVSPWMQSSIEPDTNLNGLCGGR